MFLMKRLAYRQFFAKLASEATMTTDQFAALQSMRLRPRVFSAVVDDLDGFAASSGHDFDAAAIGDGKLALWLWEHREEILAFIVKVIETFKPIFGMSVQ